MKPCSSCKVVQPSESYTKDSRRKDGLAPYCRSCYALRRRDPKRKEIRKNWDQNNRDRAHMYYSKRREQAYIRTQQWRKANPDKVAGYNRTGRHSRRASVRSNGVFLVTNRDIRRLLLRYDNSCAYCGISFKIERVTIDHVIPVKRGGTYSIGNLVPACTSCNCSKAASTLTEWKKRIN